MERAPQTNRIILSCTILTIICAMAAAHDRIPKIFLFAVLVDCVAFLAICLFNGQWRERYEIRCGAESCRVNHSELRAEYEKDYVKKDKYITQRLLHARKLPQVNDEIGAIIYMTGRYRAEKKYNKLIKEYNDLVDECDGIEVKLKRATQEAATANNDVKKFYMAYQKQLDDANHWRELYERAEEQKEMILRQYEIDNVGYCVTDREKAAEQKAKALEPAPDDLAGQDVATDAAEAPTDTPDGPQNAAKLTPGQIKDIVFKLQSGMKQTEIAKLYGISQGRISKIKKQYLAA